MAEHTARIWAEEIDPPTTWRFTWQLEGEASGLPDTQQSDIVSELREADGVLEAEADDEGLIVVIDPDLVTRYQVAKLIRQALGANPPDPADIADVARVWAEDLAEDRMRVTWKRIDDGEAGHGPMERRRVAAWLAVMPGVRSVSMNGDGVAVRYVAEQLQRASIGQTVRDALIDDVPLRKRADDLVHRAPAYGNLARKLAMDDRVSPLPEAAKQAVANRKGGGITGSAARSTAMRFIPGAAMISRIQMLLPVLQELSSWSRNADPEIVDEHLASVGITREVLLRDTITAQEIRLHARDFAGEATAELSDRAAKGARQAISSGRDLIASVRESVDARNQQSTTTSGELEEQGNDEIVDKPPAK